jgi:uncharacterized lipoprotein YehR (DUF1307 family)
MKKSILIVTLFVVLSLLTACAAKSVSMEAPAMDYTRANEAVSGAMQLTDKSSVGGIAAPEAAPSAGGGSGSVERIVLKNASLEIVVPDPAISMDRIVKMAERMGGFVVNSSLSKMITNSGVEVPYAYITIRVPADQLTAAMDEIKGQVEDPNSDVLSENISGQDVTAEYTDLKSRLVNLELAEKQLQAILATTTKTEDWLKVFNQLTETRSQIEVLKGQIKYYDESSSFSSITCNLQAQESIKPVTIGKWEPKGIALEAIQALINNLKSIYGGLLKFVLHILPVLIIYIILFGLPIWFVVWLIRTIKKQFKKTAPPVAKK